MEQISEQQNINTRYSNLELFRIIAMLLIIAHHYVVNSGLFSEGPMLNNPFAFKTFFLLLFGAWGKIGINCFLLITGYFMCKKKITAKKFFTLYFEVLFYNVIIGSIFLITQYQSVTSQIIIEMIFPIHSITKDFTSCFLVFYLLIPFITLLVQHMNEKLHISLIILILMFFTFFELIPGFQITYSYVSWFICLFIIASYFSLYPKKCFYSTKIWGIASLVTLLLSSASVLIMQYLSTNYGILDTYYFVSDSYKILALVTSISWFLFFKNINIKQSKIINILGGSTFGILLIHANSNAMRRWLWADVFKNMEVYYKDNLIYIHSFIVVLTIFIICAIIDILRKYFIEKPFFKIWDKLWIIIVDKSNKIINRFNSSKEQ